jgi:hypothetical protein
MSDPLERFRELELRHTDAADPRRIRERAQRIQMRRYQVAGGLAIAVVLLAGAALFKPGTALNELASPSTSPTPLLEVPAQSTTEIPPASQPAAPVLSQPSQESPDSGARLGSSSGVASSGRAPTTGPPPLRAELELSHETASPTNPVVMRLKVCNDGGNNVTLSFSTSQRYDFEIKNSAGELFWRWSDGRVFEQATGNETFVPGCKLLAEETWNGSDPNGRPVGAGSYEATGIVTYRDPIKSPAKKVCAITC